MSRRRYHNESVEFGKREYIPTGCNEAMVFQDGMCASRCPNQLQKPNYHYQWRICIGGYCCNRRVTSSVGGNMYDVLKTPIMWTLVHTNLNIVHPTNPRIRPSTRQCHDGYNTWRVRWLSWAEGRCCLHIGRTPDGGDGRANHHHIRSVNCVGGWEYGVVCGCPHINVPRGTIGRALLGWFSWIGRCRSVEAASPIAMVAVFLLVAYVWACIAWEMALRDSFWAKWDS